MSATVVKDEVTEYQCNHISILSLDNPPEKDWRVERSLGKFIYSKYSFLSYPNKQYFTL